LIAWARLVCCRRATISAISVAYANPRTRLRAAEGRTRRVDVGRDVSSAHDRDRGRGDAYRPRHFLNVVGFADIAVIDAYARARFLMMTSTRSRRCSVLPLSASRSR
jgi:hypothetical protein